MIFPKPSELCGLCKTEGIKCFCGCHILDLTDNYHEEINIMPTSGKAEDITKYENQEETNPIGFIPTVR